MEAKQLFEFSSRWLVCDGLIQPHFGCTLWYPLLIKALKTKKMDMFLLGARTSWSYNSVASKQHLRLSISNWDDFHA